MKIAFLNMYSGFVDRGAETFVHELAQRLSVKHKHQVTLFQTGPAKRIEDYRIVALDVGLDFARKDTSRTPWAFLFIDYWRRKVFSFTLKALPQIFREKFDVVIPVNGGWQPALVRLVTWLYGGKMVISGQSGIGWDDMNNLWSFPDAFVALSTRAKDWAEKINPLVRVEYISNGADTDKFTAKGEKLKTKLQKPIVLCVAALTPTKRVDLAIRAVSKLEDTSLLVVGDGDLKEDLERLGQKLLKDRFQLIKVPYKEMPKVYRTADVFTLPSESYYAFENVLVEAMATGLPVVANDDAIRREIVGDAGLFVDPRDTAAYAKALKDVLGRKWSDRPRRQAAKFSWDKIAAKYDKLLKGLAG